MSAKNVTVTVGGNVVATAGFIKWIQGTGTTYTVAVDAQTDYITVTDNAAGGGTVATDTIFDAKGDLAVGTGADTSVALTVGTRGDALNADTSTTTGVHWVPDRLNVRAFGATGDGVTDDTVAVQAALDAIPVGGGTVLFPPGTYLAANLILPSRQGMVLKGTGGIIKKNAVGPIITTPGAGWGQYLTFEEMRLDGDGANFTGVGISVGASSAFMKFLGGYIINTTSYCLDYTTDGCGSQGGAVDCLLTIYQGQAAQANAGVAVIKLPLDATQSANRGFVNVVTNACQLVDDFGSQNSRFEACAARNLIMTNAAAATPGKFFLVGCRISSSGVAIAMRGSQNVVIGNALAGPLQIEGSAATGIYSENVVDGSITLAVGTNNNTVVGNRITGTITDSGTSNSIIDSAPGGELGGTWGSPTVDATHSGSTHHAQSHNHSAAGDGTTLQPVALKIPTSVTPAQTADGQAVWDSDGDFLTVGDGAARQTFYPVNDATSVPLAVGTTASGTEASFARKDHVHATGAGTPSTQAFGDAAAIGAGPAASMTDHKHAMPADPVTAHVAAADPHTGYVLESLAAAKGDIYGASADNTPAITTVGANDTILMADSAQATGLKWAAAATTSEIANIAATESAGTSDTYARGDHVHAYEFDQFMVIKTADNTPVNNSTTFVNDTHLVSPSLVANSVWQIRLLVRYSTSTVAGIKFALTGTNTPTFEAGYQAAHGASGSALITTLGATLGAVTGGTLPRDVIIIGTVFVGVTATVLTWQFAQNALEVSDTKTLIHSTFSGVRLA